MRYYTVTVRAERGADKQVRSRARMIPRACPIRAPVYRPGSALRCTSWPQSAHQKFVLLSKDLPASFQPYRSAAQFAAADAPPPLAPPVHSVPRAISVPRQPSTASKLHAPTSAHQQRLHAPVHVSLATITRLAGENRERKAEAELDPFARVFSREEPTRLLASRREDVRARIAKVKADEASWLREKMRERGHTPPKRNNSTLAEQLESFDPGELPAPVPPLLNFARHDADWQSPGGVPMSAAEVAFERQKRAVLMKLFAKHEYKMREVQKSKVNKQYVPPHVPSREVDRLQMEKDGASVMRKLILRPRSHTFE